MASRSELKIYRLSGICGLLIVAALVVPRFITNPEGGFASGSSAILVFLVMLAATLLFSIYLLTITLQQYNTLSNKAKVAGILPSLVLSITLFGLFGFLSY